MHSHRPTRDQIEYLDAVSEATFAEPWAPDGLTFEDVLPLKTLGNAQIRRSGAPEPTTWLAMNDEERAAIRRRLRSVRPGRADQAAAGHESGSESGPAAVA